MKLKPHYKIIFSLFLVLFILPLKSCKDDQDYIPYVQVNFTIDLNIYNDLTTTGFSALYPKDGYGGIIVFCQQYDNITPTNSIYYAYDATCTFEISKDCSVEIPSNSVNAKCPCCGSEYSLFDGFPFKGEAEQSLKYYSVSLLNNKLYVKN